MEDVGTVFCPENFKQAHGCDDADLWDASMGEEVGALNQNGTWVTV